MPVRTRIQTFLNINSKMARAKQFDPEVALDAAVDQFWECGFEATNVQDLCRKLKLNPGSLYATFGDKRSLFVAVFDRYVERVSRDAIDRIASEPSGLASISAYFDFLVAAIVSGKRRWGCLITNSLIELGASQPEIEAKIALHFARLETAFADALARARLRGELKSDVGPEAASYLVCVVQGLNVLARTKPTHTQLAAVVSTALSSLSERHPAAP
jgi:TetR/AcrR family transcriptional regulator, transcriptional repressor for nem operon